MLARRIPGILPPLPLVMLGTLHTGNAAPRPAQFGGSAYVCASARERGGECDDRALVVAHRGRAPAAPEPARGDAVLSRLPHRVPVTLVRERTRARPSRTRRGMG